MTGSLYSMAILRLAAASGDWPLVQTNGQRVIRRSALCGSVVTVDLALDEENRVNAFGIEAKACALGQAAATLLGRHMIGCSATLLDQVATDWRDWLSGQRDVLPDWPGIDALEEVKAYSARHGAVLLPFEAAAQAAISLARPLAHQAHD
jgi:NifU-like protein involved in Fe-S cluster formation